MSLIKKDGEYPEHFPLWVSRKDGGGYIWKAEVGTSWFLHMWLAAQVAAMLWMVVAIVVPIMIMVGWFT